MKQAMLEMLRKLDGVVDVLPPPDIAQPTITDMDALFRIVTDEQQVFDTVFQEMIRQISAHMVERGEILTEVRERYNRLFQRVPNHVKRIYFEAVAHRKIVKRLLQEFDRVREEVMTLMKEVALIGQFDRTIETHAHQLQLKVAHSFSSAETEEDTLGEYQTLYRLQSERMLIQLRAAEKERTMWMESASSLALQIARDHDVEELMIMQEKGRARMLAVQHVLAKIIGANEKEVGIIQNEVNMWRKHVNTISESLLGEDHSDIDRLAGVLRSMKQDFMVTSLNRPQEGILETENAVLEPASRADTKTVVEHLRSWLETISDVSDRYATDRNIEASEGLAQCRAHAERWIELARKTLYRCEHGVNGTEYHDRLSDLRVLSGDISSLLDNLEQRTTGENGVVKALFALQSQIEFRLNTLQARGHGRALNQAEATVLSDALDKWKRELTGVITTQSQYSQQSQSAVSDRIDEFLSKVVEQMQADTTARTEGNNQGG